MTSHDVVLEWPDGRTRAIEVGEDETILAVAERAGSVLPYGCRTGACGTCTGRLLAVDETDPDADDGDASEPPTEDAVAYRRPPRALKDRHRADGYVLLCLASPRTDCRVAVGASVHSELVENPWK